jgi:hypothetical protein
VISKSFRFFIVLMIASSAVYADALPEKIFDVEFEPISEMSGFVKSKRYEDVFWVHNDSGDKARLFAIDGKGKVIYPGWMNVYGEHPVEGKDVWQGHSIEVAANVDWEDIAVDEEFIYVADTGNNGNARRDLGVYVIPELNPRAVGETRPLKYLPIRFPDQNKFPAEQWHYDVESIFVFRKKLYFISKHRQPGEIAKFEKGAVLYRLDTQFTDRFNVLKPVESHDGIMLATAADVSPNGDRLAVLSYAQLWVFDKPRRGDLFFSATSYKLDLDYSVMGLSEAVTWVDEETIWVGSESRSVFAVKVEQIPLHNK